MQPVDAFVRVPDPDYPGWDTWQLSDPELFNGAVMGRMIVRAEGERQVRLRLLDTGKRHGNLFHAIHGGVILAFIDIASFATAAGTIGGAAAGAVTLDVSCQFVGAGKLGRQLDSVGEIVRETRRLVFVRGLLEQDGEPVASYLATIRKASGTAAA